VNVAVDKPWDEVALDREDLPAGVGASRSNPGHPVALDSQIARDELADVGLKNRRPPDDQVGWLSPTGYGD
jgi:hypothetical protein